MVDCNEQTIYRQITWKIEGTLQILFEETDQDLGNGRDITRSVCAKEAKRQVCQVSVCNGWNLKRLHGTTRRKTIQCRRLFLTSMTITPITILQLVGELRIIEGWHWIRDTQLKEDSQYYRGNGVALMGNHRSVALNLLQLGDFNRYAAACKGSTTRSW